MNIDDYESLPTTSVTVNMTAGAIAGVMEHIVMYPMDSVKAILSGQHVEFSVALHIRDIFLYKTRMQSLSPTTANYNIAATFKNMIKKEGILRPIRGVTAVVAGAGPAHALYFGSYEMAKELMTKVTTHNHINYMASGVMATLIHDAISNPAEVIKQRLQMYNSPYRSVVGCLRGVYQKEGIKAFYRSYSTQLVMNIPNQTIHFSTYEFLQNVLNHERKYNPPVHVIAGGAAGACASAITTPLDVVKTLLNTQEFGLVKGMLEAIKKIYSVAGPLGFFKGLTARVLYAMPANAICWSTYEFFKFYLCGIDPELYKSTITGKSMLQPRKALTPDLAKDVHIPNAYLMVPVPETTEELKNSKESSTTAAIPHSPTPPPAIPTGPIKTVCELSTSVTSPTLNLTTRHTEVKNPFDRGFSSP